MSKEIWLPVKDFEQEYIVSNKGVIKSLWGNIIKPYHIKKFIRNNKGIIIETTYTSTLYVKLYKDKRQRQLSVASIVAQSFDLVDNNKKFRIQYKDMNKTNNSVDNFKIVYFEDNKYLKQ
jgi:K+/H+ antiporter YhaU regulatory subunit KhtT